MNSHSLNHTLEVLEFWKISGKLKDLCLSDEGRKLVETSFPSAAMEKIERLLDDTDCMKNHLSAGKKFPDLYFPPVEYLFDIIKKQGSVLEGSSIADIGTYLKSARLFSSFFRPDEESLRVNPCLCLSLFYRNREKIFETLNPDGSVKDTHPSLRLIRKRILALNNEISVITNRYVQQNREIMQSDVPTQKDGRIVLPLKANFKGRIQGIIHDSSARGATLFIEPLDLVDKNNDLAYEENRYRLEVIKILKELTSVVRNTLPEIIAAVRDISYADSIYARARYSILYSCSRASRSEKHIKLNRAVHPLLGKAAVPIDIHMDATIRVLVITGPNTGGKTVSLKTVGLLALMNQYGMHIPAAEGSCIPVFDEILADIGDDQSIENSLSTFSGHMVNISNIIKASTRSSLVLLDDLGSGTDPEEGSALALSILDYFLQKGSTVIVSTHNGVIKNYAATRKGAENASVSFDPETSRPTYRIIQGLPGESFAIETAEANGIPPSIISKARNYISGRKQIYRKS